MKKSGRNLLLRLVAAWMTFSIGVVIHLAWPFQNSLTGDANQLVAPVAPLREDNLHRLYEAARVSTSRHLINRLRCIKADGSIDAIAVCREEPLEQLMFVVCLNPDGSKYIWEWQLHEEFVQRHRRWSLNNIEFLRTINTPEKAEEYIRTQSPYYSIPRYADEFRLFY